MIMDIQKIKGEKMKEAKHNKIHFKDLTGYVKAGIIGGWVAIITYGLSFLIGIIEGLFLS